MRPWLFYIVFAIVYTGAGPTTLADGVSPQEARQLRDEVISLCEFQIGVRIHGVVE